jgi:hypothetical protein
MPFFFVTQSFRLAPQRVCWKNKFSFFQVHKCSEKISPRPVRKALKTAFFNRIMCLFFFVVFFVIKINRIRNYEVSEDGHCWR